MSETLEKSKKELRLFAPMSIYSLALVLTPTNIIARVDRRFPATIILQKRTAIVLKKRLPMLLIQFKTDTKSKRKTNG